MKIFNTMTRRKEEFVPVHEGKVGIYACGPTVYDYFHIGNARMFIVFDILRRYMEYKGYDVTFVQNFTDIDDKMIKRANSEGITVKELGDKFIEEYFKDAKALGIKKASVHPRATEHISEIIRLVEKLVENKLAYTVNGDVYFDTAAYPPYGKLSGQNLEDLNAGARISVDETKKNPADFALWKSYKEGEPFWESPWGRGRPGWHIECSAMSMRYLGESFDIHCGGHDLIFPHHENEIAQSEGATGKTFAKYWMHNGFLNIDNQKMSKSKGTFFTVRDITKEFNAEDVRMFMLSAHYRSPLNFSREQMQQAHASLERIYSARDRARELLESAKGDSLTKEEMEKAKELEGFESAFVEAMDDDLNTAEATAAIFNLVYAMNTGLNPLSSKKMIESYLSMLEKLCSALGIMNKAEEELPGEVLELLEARHLARLNKNWAESDSIRDKVKALGYIIEDGPKGQKAKKL